MYRCSEAAALTRDQLDLVMIGAVMSILSTDLIKITRLKAGNKFIPITCLVASMPVIAQFSFLLVWVKTIYKQSKQATWKMV